MSKNQQKNNSNFDLQNQIFSMLKGVGVIEENEFEFKENINEIKDNLFGDDDFSNEEFEDAETNHNTTISYHGNDLRSQNEKSLTIKIDNMIFNNHNQIFRRRKKNSKLKIIIQIIHLIKLIILIIVFQIIIFLILLIQII